MSGSGVSIHLKFIVFLILIQQLHTNTLVLSPQNLYILSDLTQYLVQEKSRAHSWILTSYPGQIKLPRELFAPLGHNDLCVEVWCYGAAHSTWLMLNVLHGLTLTTSRTLLTSLLVIGIDIKKELSPR